MAFARAHRSAMHAPILEVGSRNVNGSLRELKLPDPYTGIDLVEGPGVDLIADAADMPFDDASFSTVISASMLEHALDPVAVLSEMARVLAPGGFLLVTAAANGFPFHNPPDRWRFLPGTMTEILRGFGLTDVREIQDPQVPGCFATAAKASE